MQMKIVFSLLMLDFVYLFFRLCLDEFVDFEESFTPKTKPKESLEEYIIILMTSPRQISSIVHNNNKTTASA